MRIRLKIFYPALVNSLDIPEEITVNGNTVGDCLKDFTRQYPGSDKWIFNTQGELSGHVFVYINTESARNAAMDDPVKEGDLLLLGALIVGG